MKKYFIQFLIISISFWILSPLVDLFVSAKSIRGVDVYMNDTLIVKSIVFGLLFAVVFNLMIRR
tara:strand:- start:158 stop:349 length:192 start_codon:yes stop_codon:yes gene_type:complete